MPFKHHCKHGHEYVAGSFSMTKDRNGKPYRDCRICRRARVRASHQKRRYGITNDERMVLFVSQGSCCAGCKTTIPGGNGWHTDHDHLTKKVRGVLCPRCNQALGQVDDRVEVLQNLIEYLKKHEGLPYGNLHGKNF